MFRITDYALPSDIAERVADEVSCYAGVAAMARKEVRALRAELAKERETADAYRFVLGVCRWPSDSRGQ